METKIKTDEEEEEVVHNSNLSAYIQQEIDQWIGSMI